MECALCKEAIERYSPAYHRLKIDERRSADLCQACIDKLLRWQGEIHADLFPTKAMKRRFGKEG